MRYYVRMIGRLSGKTTHKDGGVIIVDVGGVGYRVNLPKESVSKISVGDKTDLWTHLHVRENALDLYGFIEKEQVEFFELLIGVSGVGPKTALAILSIAPPKTLAIAIVQNNTSYLTRVSGIGKRNAEKIIVELKDRLRAVVKDEDGIPVSETEDAILALRSLGYSTREAQEALSRIPDDTTETQEQIKEALKHLGKSG
jgi:holliday junction DNA helicase RuvA